MPRYWRIVTSLSVAWFAVTAILFWIPTNSPVVIVFGPALGLPVAGWFVRWVLSAKP